jgi:hypothetical protein
VERQPGGRFVYEYDRTPYPPLVETESVTLSPRSMLAGEAEKVSIVGSVTTVSSADAVVMVPRASVTVQTTVTVPVVV